MNSSLLVAGGTAGNTAETKGVPTDKVFGRFQPEDAFVAHGGILGADFFRGLTTQKDAVNQALRMYGSHVTILNKTIQSWSKSVTCSFLGGPKTRNPKSKTQNPKPETRSLNFEIRNPKLGSRAVEPGVEPNSIRQQLIPKLYA